MNKEELQKVVDVLRNRVIEYRSVSKEKIISVHLNTVEILVCLVDFSLKTNPSRRITQEEEMWFRGGLYIENLFENSDWSDIVDMYYVIVDQVISLNYFRE